MAFVPLRFIHLHLFDREWVELGLTDEDLRALQNAIASSPTRPPVVSGAGGMRKIRFAREGSGRGKSGAYRVGYAYYPAYRTIVLVTAWGKSERANLSQADYHAIARVLQEIEQLLQPGGDMTRERDGMTPKGKKIVAALEELRDALAAGERIEDRFTVHTVMPSSAESDPELLRVLATLRRERRRQGLSLSDVAVRTGISKTALSRLESGKVMDPTVAMLRSYARALGKRLLWSVAASDEAPSGRL
jgi:ribosome-binding protein aMBF1 (putative translation factor)